MKPISSTLFIFLIASSFAASVSLADGITPDRQECVKSPTDPYDPGATIPEGRYKGKCADTTTKRALKIISETNSEIVVANFLHLNRFWIAHIPKQAVQSLIFRIDRFSSGIPGMTPAHTLLEFKMAPEMAITLQPQDLASTQDPAHTSVSDFFLSIEFLAPKSVSYNMFLSGKNNYYSVMRFLSAEDRNSGHANSKYPSEDFALILTPAQGDALLIEAIHESSDRAYRYPYKLLSSNCTTEVFDLFDLVLKYPTRVKPFKESLRHPADSVAGPSKKALIKRGLIEEPVAEPSADDELDPS